MSNKKATIRANTYTSTHFQIQVVGGIEEAQHYLEEFEVIRNAGEHDTVHIHLNTPGGDIYTGAQFRSVLRSCPAPTVAHLESGCHSAGTLLALSCDDLIVHDDAFMLVHNYSGGAYGKGDDLLKYVSETDKWIKQLMRTTYNYFLTEEEIEMVVFKNDDIYLSAPQIRERWKDVLAGRELEDELELEETRSSLREQIKNL